MPDSQKVISLASRRPAPQPDGVGDQETIGSLYRRMVHARGGPKPPQKRRLGTLASRKALQALERDANTMESCMAWLREIARRDHDPRALAVLVDFWTWYAFDRADLAAIRGLLDDVLTEMARGLPPDLTPVE